MGVPDGDRRCPLRPLTRWSTDPSLKPTFKNKSFGEKAEASFDHDGSKARSSQHLTGTSASKPTHGGSGVKQTGQCQWGPRTGSRELTANTQESALPGPHQVFLQPERGSLQQPFPSQPFRSHPPAMTYPPHPRPDPGRGSEQAAPWAWNPPPAFSARLASTIPQVSCPALLPWGSLPDPVTDPGLRYKVSLHRAPLLSRSDQSWELTFITLDEWLFPFSRKVFSQEWMTLCT
ncbi:hypothetical protein J1605_004358 [Eschrichtius robustus]|uniref:Uncharacterized protein n=1 Tax=Eschrichtius robustus TaxID=9764 RepID=A0AB34HHW0_ESCRO|nr:hypothetical protein J1605_004358 [Eschrichtius robustus]